MMPLADTAVETETPAMPWPWDLVPWPYLVAAAAVVALIAMVTGAVRRRLGVRRRPFFSLKWRAKLHIHPGPGWVNGWDRWRSLGLPAARQVAKATRPSLSWWDRHRPGGWREYATHIGTAWGWVFRRRVVATGEDVVLTIAGPRRGKSAASACRIIDAPGKVLATSIRDDALKSTIGPRSEKGTVYVWNPEGLGAYGSNMRWNPVAGCQDAQTAIRRAGYMVESQTRQGLSDAGFWSNQASVALAGMLHAAALAGYGMDHVYAWAQGTDDTPIQILRRHKQANEAQHDDVAQFLKAMPERTKASVAITLRDTLQFMRSPEVAALVTPGTGAESEVAAPAWFDVEEFLLSQGSETLYLVSAGDDGVTAPLFCALIAELAYSVRYGAAQKGGKLDPPLDMELDEIANIAPIPVHEWVSWMGGAGIRMRIYAQNWAQLTSKYREMAHSVWDCASMKVIYGGATEEALLKQVTSLAGTERVRGKDQVHYTYDRDGNRVKEKTPTYEFMEVLPASEMRLERHWAVVFSNDVAPCLVSTPKAWKRTDVRRWKNHTPACVVEPVRREVPQADPGLRRRLEQEGQGDVQEQVRPLRAVATGTDGGADAPATGGDTSGRRPEAAEESTQPMPSMRDQVGNVSPLTAFIQRTAPKGGDEDQGNGGPAPWERERPSPARDRDRTPRPRRDCTPPALRRPPPAPQADARAGGRRRPHPAPWDLPRSQPTPPGPDEGEQEDRVEPPRAGRLPWDDWEQ